jgi:hypothetical protein
MPVAANITSHPTLDFGVALADAVGVSDITGVAVSFVFTAGNEEKYPAMITAFTDLIIYQKANVLKDNIKKILSGHGVEK